MGKALENWIKVLKTQFTNEIKEFKENDLLQKLENEKIKWEKYVDSEVLVTKEKLISEKNKRCDLFREEFSRRRNLLTNKYERDVKNLEEENMSKINNLNSQIINQSDKISIENKQQNIHKQNVKKINEDLENYKISLQKEELENKKKIESEMKNALLILDKNSLDFLEQKKQNLANQQTKNLLENIKQETENIWKEAEKQEEFIKIKKSELVENMTKMSLEKVEFEHLLLEIEKLNQLEKNDKNNQNLLNDEIINLRNKIEELDKIILELRKEITENEIMQKSKSIMPIKDQPNNIPELEFLVTGLQEVKNGIMTISRKMKEKSKTVEIIEKPIEKSNIKFINPSKPLKNQVSENPIKNLNPKILEISQFLENEKSELLNYKDNLLVDFEFSTQMLNTLRFSKRQINLKDLSMLDAKSTALCKKMSNIKTDIRFNEKRLYVLKLIERKLDLYKNCADIEDCKLYLEQCEKELKEVYRIYLTKFKYGKNSEISRKYERSKTTGTTGETEDFV